MKRKSLRSLIILVSLTGLIQCRSEEIVRPEVTVLANGDLVGAVLPPGDRLITDPLEWKQFLVSNNKTLEMFGGGSIADTTIDFETFQVLVVFNGYKATSRYELEIKDIHEVDDNSITIVHHHPSSPAGERRLTQSYLIAKLPRTTGPLQIEHTSIEPWIYSQVAVKGNISGNENIPDQRIVITDRNEWTSLLTQMNSYYHNPDFFNAVPTVDFDKYMAIAVFDTIRPGCCNSIDITDVYEADDQVTVTVDRLWAVIIGIESQPFEISIIPKSTKAVVFVEAE